MRFLIQRISLIHLLQAVSDPAHPLLRIESLGGLVALSCGSTEAGCDASIERSRVCFLRQSKLKKLVQTYHSDSEQGATIDIEVTPDHIRVGRTILPRDSWEISLFSHPTTAPMILRFQAPPEPGPEAEYQMNLPFSTVREFTPKPPHFLARFVKP